MFPPIPTIPAWRQWYVCKKTCLRLLPDTATPKIEPLTSGSPVQRPNHYATNQATQEGLGLFRLFRFCLQFPYFPVFRFYHAMLCIRGTSHGPVSVCPSVTSRSSTKTAKRRITQTTPHDSPGRLVF